MDDSLDPIARRALTASLKEKVERLVTDQAKLTEQRAALLVLQRRNDRELADCRATARLFQLEIEIPTPDRDEVMLREREMMEMERRRERLRAEQMARQRAEAETHAVAATTSRVLEVTVPVNVPIPGATPLPAGVSMPVAVPKRKPPPVKVFLADRLRAVGAEGAKAAPLREAYARAYGVEIHEKTVGMTLYRMANEGLVRREGHTWFLADPPPGGSAENPGGETPGSNQLL